MRESGLVCLQIFVLSTALFCGIHTYVTCVTIIHITIHNIQLNF
jgi:hypothetical protein